MYVSSLIECSIRLMSSIIIQTKIVAPGIRVDSIIQYQIILCQDRTYKQSMYNNIIVGTISECTMHK